MTNGPSYDGYHKYTGSVAATYDRDRQVEGHWWKEDQFVREYFREKVAPRLLDIPVGTGRFFPHYKLAGTVVGVDVSDDMLSEARQKLTSLPPGTAGSVERGDVFSLRFNDREFTHAVVWRLFHLIPAHLLPDAVAELCRVTAHEIVVQTYPAARAQSTPREIPYRTRLVRGLRRVGRSLNGLVSSTSRSRAADGGPPTVATEGAVPEAETPWSHIQAYSHPQDLVDSLFLNHGFAPHISRHLDTYDSCDVRVTIYQR
jgi:ubiquinone/menaquinone biosynthesis C-methylase UbiE